MKRGSAILRDASLARRESKRRKRKAVFLREGLERIEDEHPCLIVVEHGAQGREDENERFARSRGGREDDMRTTLEIGENLCLVHLQLTGEAIGEPGDRMRGP